MTKSASLGCCGFASWAAGAFFLKKPNIVWCYGLVWLVREGVNLRLLQGKNMQLVRYFAV